MVEVIKNMLIGEIIMTKEEIEIEVLCKLVEEFEEKLSFN